MFRIWYSTEEFADFIINNTIISELDLLKSRLYESDASNSKQFHKIPDHIKKILYLDSPDIIVEYRGNPVFSIEISQEAGTGHNAFQRFPRLAASIEAGVPALYIYPQAAFIRRNDNREGRWDKINPSIFKTMEKQMQIYDVPSLLFYFPSEYPNTDNVSQKGMKYDESYIGQPDSTDEEMKNMFSIINLLIRRTSNNITSPKLLTEREISNRRSWMQDEFIRREGDLSRWSPITSTIELSTSKVIDFIKRYHPHADPELLKNRSETIIYQVDAGFRGDPYPGALAAIDYLLCRTGKTYEDRDKNLILCWGKIELDESDKINVVSSTPDKNSVESFFTQVRKVLNTPKKCLLNYKFVELNGEQIPRYYMQVRYGYSFTKSKEIRCYSYFADGIFFHDGAIWREG